MVQTDRFEQTIIKALGDLYGDAMKDVEKQIKQFNAQFSKADLRMRQQLDAGKITDEYYKRWRKVQISRSKRWETMRNQMADRMKNADKQAAAYINNTLPSIYALNHDYTCYTIDQAGVMEGGSFTLTNERTVRELVMGDNHVSFKTVRPKLTKNYNYNVQRLQRALTLGILSGKSTDKIATDFMRIMGTNRKSAVRAARTAVTSAQNAGCQSAFDQATDMGISIQKEWMCTHDSRTRESHINLDGQRVDNDATFSNGLRYPGDPNGAPAEVYNCRCTMRAILPAMIKAGDADRKLYKDWLKEQQTEGESDNAITGSITGDVDSGNFNEYGDFLREKVGSALENNYDECMKIVNEVEENGGSIEFNDTTNMVTNVSRGQPATIKVDRNISLPGLLHERRHFFDDVKNGCPGISYYLKDPDKMFEYERRGYEEELEYARKMGYTDVIDKINNEIEERRKEIYGDD